jgi:hypothetical protein
MRKRLERKEATYTRKKNKNKPKNKKKLKKKNQKNIPLRNSALPKNCFTLSFASPPPVPPEETSKA